MASIFTWEPDTPRVASPWLQSVDEGNQTASVPGSGRPAFLPGTSISTDTKVRRAQGKIVRLQAEPQDGPVEYKLHLLLRPRRKFASTSTGDHVAGTVRSLPVSSATSRSVSESMMETGNGNTPATSQQQTRQHRLEQLTTQLLWRLQQSSPHHTSSASNIILPSLPEALPELQPPLQPGKLLHGLEESQGALYEIGVSDDGTLIGLAEDELHESLNNLRAMASCLGCTVEVLRKEVVGECEWLEDAKSGRNEEQVTQTGALFVAEAIVKPDLMSKISSRTPQDASIDASTTVNSANTAVSPTEQLRVTLAGPTMSGKSTLLGTLTTSTLDSGRGKSRLSMLKHRHEITTGITSSVTQELLGYQDVTGGDVEVANYATENIASWIDIHRASAGCRLVLITDSAGHPRYRRTTVRSLVGWAPHWTLLCIPADDTDDTTTRIGGTRTTRQGFGGGTFTDMDLLSAQLDLCLRLSLPLVIIITKLDLASRTGLKETLSRVLDELKAAGRKPVIFRNSPGSVSEDELGLIDSAVVDKACDAVVPLLNNPIETVPILLTSAVQGTGISNLHALLHELPIPTQQSNSNDALFYIEDVYNKPAEVAGVIVSGLLRSGHVTIGDEMMLGPFSTHDQSEDSEDSDGRPHRRSESHLPASRSFPGAFRSLQLLPPRFQLPGQEWKRVKVTSVRNLRLPVHSLFADQVGTIALDLCDDKTELGTASSAFSRIRKGMVLTPIQPTATRIFVAEFDRNDLTSLAVGNHIVVYIASIRASAKVVSARTPDSPVEIGKNGRRRQSPSQHGPFELDEDASDSEHTEPIQAKVAGVVTADRLQVTFSFDSSRELVVLGDKVLVMPGGGPGLFGGQERGQKGVAGLNGFVGKVVDIVG